MTNVKGISYSLKDIDKLWLKQNFFALFDQRLIWPIGKINVQFIAF